MSDSSQNVEGDYNATEPNPALSNAIQSSLWELGELEHHYLPTVATLAKSIGREVETQIPLHNIDEFVCINYASLLEQERSRRKRNKTPLTFVKPKGLFSPGDVFAGVLKIPAQE